MGFARHCLPYLGFIYRTPHDATARKAISSDTSCLALAIAKNYSGNPHPRGANARHCPAVTIGKLLVINLYFASLCTVSQKAPPFANNGVDIGIRS